MHRIIRLSPLCLLVFLTCPHAENQAPILVCGDPNPSEWSEVKEKSTPKQNDEAYGVSADFVRATFALMGKKFTLIGNLPWKRCLNEVQNGHIDFAMGAYFNPERAKLFDYSIHYNTLTPQIFYLTAVPVSVTQLSDLKNYHGCGIYGSSYAHYGLKSENLDLGAGYDSLLRKMRARRCDYFVEELEIIASFKSFGKDILNDGDIRHVAAPWANSPSRYLVTQKNGRNSALLNQVNEALETLIKSGKAEEIWKAQGSNIPYQP